ncbi:MAG: helix-turn-helix transcriptional regulator [Oscillospiraceae bacterium]
MAISYNPLWKLLIDKAMSKSALRQATGISTVTLAKLGKNEYVGMEIIEKICNTLHCAVEDVVVITDSTL